MTTENNFEKKKFNLPINHKQKQIQTKSNMIKGEIIDRRNFLKRKGGLESSQKMKESYDTEVLRL